jgi:hypothetical protein
VASVVSDPISRSLFHRYEFPSLGEVMVTALPYLALASTKAARVLPCPTKERTETEPKP